MDQRRQVPQHALQAHVERLGGSLHFAADVEVDLAAVQLRNHDGGVHPLAPIQRLAGFGGDSMRRP